MRFNVLASIIFTLAAAVNAVPLEASQESSQGLEARNPGQSQNAEHLARAELEARKKYRAGSYTLTVKLEKGSKPNANELDDGKRAMCEADVDAGVVVYGWHPEGTSSLDKEDHFTIKPTKGPGAGAGMIHVHKDGSWTQGTGGAAASGNGC